MLSEEEERKILESYNIKKGESKVIKRVRPRKYRQISKKITKEKVTTAILPTKPLFMVYRFVDAMRLATPYCFGGSQWVTKYKEPVIDFDIEGVEVPDVDVYILRGRITGRFDTEFTNNSEEGETWEENTDTGEERNREKVDGSADLEGIFDEDIFAKDADTILAELTDRTIKKTVPEVTITINSDFVKEGYVSMIKDLYNILKTGTIYIDDTINVEVSYEWLGEKKTVTREIPIVAYLPVGDVHYHAW